MESNDTMPFAFSDEFSPKDKSQNIIKVIGVGGGGSNAVLNMYKQGVHNVRFAICNTDSQALAQADIPVKIQLGDEGLGVEENPKRVKRLLRLVWLLSIPYSKMIRKWCSLLVVWVVVLELVLHLSLQAWRRKRVS